MIFSETYQMFILEFILNVLCTSYSKPNEILLLFKFLNRTKNTEQEHYQTHRNNFPYIGITILDYIVNNKIHCFNFTSHDEGGLPLVIKCFEFLMIYFFQVFIRSKYISSYLIGYIDLFKFFINHSVECAEMFVKELANKKAILEYITTCPKENIKKLLQFLTLINYYQITTQTFFSIQTKQSVQFPLLFRLHPKMIFQILL